MSSIGVRLSISADAARALGHEADSHERFRPYKVYVATSGERRAGLARFIVASAQARGPRIMAASMIMTIAAACASRFRRFYPAYLLILVVVVARGLAAVVASWSSPAQD
jgi:hypothetical protein